MNGKRWLAVACLLAGIPLAAYGLAGAGALLTLLGLAFIFGFWLLAWQWIASANKPARPIKPAVDVAWNLRDQVPPAAPPSAANDSTTRRGSE